MTETEYRKRATSLYESPAMQACYSAIRRLAGFELTRDQRKAFLAYHAFITSTPEPAYITELRKSKRYHQHINGVLGDAQNGLACVYYHLQRISELEVLIGAAIESSEVRAILESFHGGAVGNTLVLDFEYQAFVLAIRRCLDYLTRALSIYFKNETHSFREFGKWLDRAKPQSVAKSLQEAYNRHRTNFSFVMSEGGSRSTVDRIKHYEFIHAGVVNITTAGLVLAGGGEQLRINAITDTPPLLRVLLKKHSKNLQTCIDDLLCTFVDAVFAEERRNSS